MRAIELLEDQYEPVALGDNKYTNVNLAVKYMLEHCQPWIQAVGLNRIVYRGTNTTNDVFVRAVRDDRKPRDSGQPIHELFNKLITMAGGIANRSNSAFLAGNSTSAGIYGNVRVAIPAGEFNYTWSPKWSDWYVDLVGTNLAFGQIMYPEMKHELVKRYREEMDPLSFTAPPAETRKAFNNILYDINNYDPIAVKHTILADKNLIEAVESGYELMVKCPAVLYIEYDVYVDYVVPNYLEQQNEQNA
jgi:hypothetical protein